MYRRGIILLTAFLTAQSVLYEAKSQVSSTWSGTITEHSWFGGHPGVVAETIASIRYSRNVGTATYTETGSITVEGKVISRTNCSGTGTIGFAELSIDDRDNIYTIQSSALVYYCSYLNATPDSGELYITIGNEPWDGNPRILKGSKTLVTENGGGGKLTTITTWNLVKDSETELIVTPQNYDTWLPMPGRDEQTPGPDIMTVKLELKDRNGRPASEKAKSFVLRLNNTSKEKGITINMPLVPSAQQLPDLRFQPQTNAVITEEGQAMTLYCPGGCITTDIKIASYDGGGWTTLTAVAKLETDSIKGKLLNPGGEEDIRIPKKEDGSKIATKWLNENGNPGETDDNDEINGVPNKGDGLSAYEEYRGVICEKEFGSANPAKFGRLDPRKMNLGLRVDKAELPYFAEGIKWFENATQLKVLRFNVTEIGPDRRLNRNAGSAHVFDQFVQYLVKGTITGDAVGENQPIALTYKSPALSEKVVIDIGKINRKYQSQLVSLAAANRRYGTNIMIPYTAAEDIANTVAHELAHGINVNHHGLPSDLPNLTIPHQSVDIYHVYEDNGTTEITTRPFPINGSIGKPGNDESGDLSCIMAYTSLYQWAFRVGTDASLNYYSVKLLPVGKTLCTSGAGTGINANNMYFGNASTGNCLEQVKLRD